MKRLFTLAQRGVACFGVCFNSRGRVGVGRLLEIGRHGAPTSFHQNREKWDALFRGTSNTIFPMDIVGIHERCIHPRQAGKVALRVGGGVSVDRLKSRGLVRMWKNRFPSTSDKNGKRERAVTPSPVAGGIVARALRL